MTYELLDHMQHASMPKSSRAAALYWAIPIWPRRPRQDARIALHWEMFAHVALS